MYYSVLTDVDHLDIFIQDFISNEQSKGLFSENQKVYCALGIDACRISDQWR